MGPTPFNTKHTDSKLQKFQCTMEIMLRWSGVWHLTDGASRLQLGPHTTTQRLSRQGSRRSDSCRNFLYGIHLTTCRWLSRSRPRWAVTLTIDQLEWEDEFGAAYAEVAQTKVSKMKLIALVDANRRGIRPILALRAGPVAHGFWGLGLSSRQAGPSGWPQGGQTVLHLRGGARERGDLHLRAPRDGKRPP